MVMITAKKGCVSTGSTTDNLFWEYPDIWTRIWDYSLFDDKAPVVFLFIVCVALLNWTPGGAFHEMLTLYQYTCSIQFKSLYHSLRYRCPIFNALYDTIALCVDVFRYLAQALCRRYGGQYPVGFKTATSSGNCFKFGVYVKGSCRYWFVLFVKCNRFCYGDTAVQRITHQFSHGEMVWYEVLQIGSL